MKNKKINWDLITAIYLPVLLIAYSLYRWLFQSRQDLIILADSHDYLFNAKMPLNLEFFCHPKPAGIALAYKLLQGRPEAIVSYQILLSIISWGLLALCVFWLLKNKLLKYIGFLAILLMSINADVLLHDLMIMSESISISLFILLIAAGLLMIKKQSLPVVVLFGTLAFAWGLTKETNGLLLSLLSVFFLAIGLMFKSRARMFALGVFLIISVMVFRGFSNLGERWKFPLLNVIAQRVLPDEKSLAFFVDNGMPVNEALTDLTYGWGHSNDKAFLNSPDLRDFQKWFHENGKQTFTRYLFHFPLKSFLSPIQHMRSVMTAPEYAIKNPLYPDGWRPFSLFLYLLSLALSVGLLAKDPKQSMLWFLTVLLLLVYPHIFLVWNGDAMESLRHATGLRIHLWVGVYLACLYLADLLMPFGKAHLKKPETTLTSSDKPLQFAPIQTIIRRGWIALGVIIIAFTLLYDLISAVDYYSFEYVIGKNQFIIILIGIMIFLTGVIFPGRILANTTAALNTYPKEVEEGDET